jgi:hypothetical protein
MTVVTVAGETLPLLLATVMVQSCGLVVIVVGGVVLVVGHVLEKVVPFQYWTL